MFNVSFSELLFIFILAFIVLGPEKLPRTFYSLGIIVRKIKHEYDKIQREINNNINLHIADEYKSSKSTPDSKADQNTSTKPSPNKILEEN